MDPHDRERGEGREVTVSNGVNGDAAIARSCMLAREGGREGDDGGRSGCAGEETGERGSTSSELLVLMTSCPRVSMGVMDGAQESVS